MLVLHHEDQLPGTHDPQILPRRTLEGLLIAPEPTYFEPHLLNLVPHATIPRPQLGELALQPPILHQAFLPEHLKWEIADPQRKTQHHQEANDNPSSCPPPRR